VATTRTEDGEK